MKVSIIIPTCNRCAALRRTLASLQQVNFTSLESEILVVDNGSMDQTRQVVDDANRDSARAIHYFFEPIPGLLSGRHRGALEAKGDICAYLDDDVRLDRHWLLALEEGFQNSSVAMVGGPSSPLFESPPPDWLDGFYRDSKNGRHCGWLSLFDGGERIKEINPCYVWGLNFAVRRKVLLDLGGFHPDSVPKRLQRFQGDGETGFSLKLQRTGLKALYHPRAALEHEVPASRLTVDYFEQRAFFQGVCDSYTKIRAEGGVAQAMGNWKKPLRRIKRFLLGAARAGDTTLGNIRNRTARAYQAGYSFHQEEVRNDPKLLAWVSKPDYFDYRLPEGWEDYLKQGALSQ